METDRIQTPGRRRPHVRILPFPLAALLLLAPALAEARTSNGNDFALYFSEARNEEERQELLEDAKGRPHFFRYLQIMEMEDTSENGREGVYITAFEPASCLDVKFTVTRPVSLSLLREAPVSKKGSAIAVTGIVVGVKEPATQDDKEKTAILLGQTIVRHKDRLSPKIGKELLAEVDPGAVFYSYTAGPRPVNLSYRDRDLIQHRDRILKASGPKGWVEFLEKEVAKREKQRKEAESAIPDTPQKTP